MWHSGIGDEGEDDHSFHIKHLLKFSEASKGALFPGGDALNFNKGAFREGFDGYRATCGEGAFSVLIGMNLPTKEQ